MLVRVSHGNGFNITIPISLLVLDQTFDALEDLVWLVEKLFLRWIFRARCLDDPYVKHEHFLTRANIAEAPSHVLRLCREMIDELRSYGRWRMVEVEVPSARVKDRKSRSCGHHRGNVRVYIDFI